MLVDRPLLDDHNQRLYHPVQTQESGKRKADYQRHNRHGVIHHLHAVSHRTILHLRLVHHHQLGRQERKQSRENRNQNSRERKAWSGRQIHSHELVHGLNFTLGIIRQLRNVLLQIINNRIQGEQNRELNQRRQTAGAHGRAVLIVNLLLFQLHLRHRSLILLVGIFLLNRLDFRGHQGVHLRKLLLLNRQRKHQHLGEYDKDPLHQ